jgi:hypothetical protein
MQQFRLSASRGCLGSSFSTGGKSPFMTGKAMLISVFFSHTVISVTCKKQRETLYE